MDCQEDHHRRYEHGSGVERQENSGNSCQGHDKEPQQEHAAPAQPREPVRDNLEQPGLVQQFRQQGHRKHEGEDGNGAARQGVESGQGQ